MVPLNNLNLVDLFFWKIINILSFKKLYMLFFQENIIITCKIKFFITFTSIIQMESIKHFQIDKILFFIEFY